MSKKKLVSLAVVAIMIAILSFSTLAWFNAQDKISNDFTVSDSMNDFDVDVWEIVENKNGVQETIGKGNKDENGYVYDNIAPGKTYTKTVYVENTSNNDLAGQYIKAEVTFTNYKALKTMGADSNALYDCTGMLLGGSFCTSDSDTCAWWYDSNNVVISADESTATYTFYLKDVLENGESVALFERVQLPTTMDINDADELLKTADKGFQIKVVAYAIQSANIKNPNNGATTLDHVKYAFNTEWANRQNPAPTP